MLLSACSFRLKQKKKKEATTQKSQTNRFSPNTDTFFNINNTLELKSERKKNK